MNAIKDVMMNKVLAGEAGKEKAREWGRWLATDEGQAYLAAQMDADFFEECLCHTRASACGHRAPGHPLP